MYIYIYIKVALVNGLVGEKLGMIAQSITMMAR